jgi:hypothetical protein
MYLQKVTRCYNKFYTAPDPDMASALTASGSTGSKSFTFLFIISNFILISEVKKTFFAYYFLEVHLHHFSKIKSNKKSQNSRNQGFSYYFCLMKEGSGSVPLTNGAGSGRPKIIRIPDRIHNTSVKFYFANFIASGSVMPMRIRERQINTVWIHADPEHCN